MTRRDPLQPRSPPVSPKASSKPDGVDDESCSAFLEGSKNAESAPADMTPGVLTEGCEHGPSDRDAARAEDSAKDLGRSAEERLVVWNLLRENLSRPAGVDGRMAVQRTTALALLAALSRRRREIS